MSPATIETLMLLVIAAAVMIPLAIVAWYALAMIRDSRARQTEEARRVTVNVPGLGSFTSTDNALWFGSVAGLHVSLVSRDHRPSETHAAQVHAILRDLTKLVQQGRTYLAEREEDLRSFAADLEPCALELDSPASFVLELTHKADPDGVYRVVFQHSEPVDWGYDD